MYVSFIVSFIVRCRVSEEIKCSVWELGVIGDNCICVCGCELCGLIGDKVVSKVMLVLLCRIFLQSLDWCIFVHRSKTKLYVFK